MFSTLFRGLGHYAKNIKKPVLERCIPPFIQTQKGPVNHLSNRPVVELMTIQNVVDKFFKDVGSSPNWSPNVKRNLKPEYVPRNQADLPVRRMQDSYTEVIIPLGQNEAVRDRYMTSGGTVRFGRILEDLDVTAAYTGLKHVMIPNLPAGVPLPLDVVTALVDRIDLRLKSLSAQKDIKICSFVSWVGKSSIEITLELNQLRGRTDQWDLMLTAKFVMVAKDPLGLGPVAINSLELSNDDERTIFQEGNENKDRRSQFESQSLLKTIPSTEEMQLIHNMFLQTVDIKNHTFKARVVPESSVFMEEAKLKNLLICYPQHRNRYNKIFGGFLMRQAFELGWALAHVQGKLLPKIMNVDDILFRKPVEIGSLLYLMAQVVYGGKESYLIRVNAQVVDPIAGTSETTNVFYFTFKFPPGSNVPSVIPRTYSDSMLYLDGKRHFELVMQSQ